MKKPAFVIFGLVVALSMTCGKKGASSSAGGQSDGPDGLKQVFTNLQKYFETKDYKKARDLTLSVLPDKEALRKVIKDGTPDETLDQILAPFKPFAEERDDAKVALALVAGKGRTEIKVWPATVEQLRSYDEKDRAVGEFDGNVKRLAESILKPGITFYEVEVTEPGKDSGMKYHMFFWDGSRWRMMGAAWRAVK